MKLKFQPVYRALLVVLAVLLGWSWWASGQITNAPANGPSQSVTHIVAGPSSSPDSKPGYLTFGLDHVKWLQTPWLHIPLWQYLAALIYIFLAFFLSKLVDVLVSSQLKKWAKKTPTIFDDLILDLIHGPIKVVTFVILLDLGLNVFTWGAWFENVLAKILKVIVAGVLTYLALRIVDLLINYWRQRSVREDDRTFHQQLVPMIRNTLKVFVVVVAFLVTSQNLGFNVTGLIASLSIGGLAVGLAAQDTLANLFGAVSVLIDKPFRVGDRILIESVDGVVETIGFRSTRVRNLDGHLVSIPNKTVGNAIITNIALRPNIRTLINISVTYDTPVEKMKEALQMLEEIYRSHPMTQDVWISFNKFADSSLNIFVVHWWRSTVYKDYLAGMQELNLTIKERFDAAGIGFAFPTQTLYLKQDSDWALQGDLTRMPTPEKS